MTVREYLGGLERGLRGMDECEREDFLREMESHIADLRERRPEESEEAIVAGLTPPESLAAELLGAGSGEGAASEGARNEGARGEPGAGRRTSGSDAFGSREGGRDRGVGERLREALGLLESLGGLGRRAGRDEAEFARELPGEGLASVRVFLLSGDVRVRPSADGRLRLRAEGLSDEDRLRITRTGGRLELLEENHGGPSIEGLELELPDGGIEALELETKSGDLDIEGFACAVSAKTLSGDIVARECPGSVQAESASGDIHLEACGRASAATLSGDISVEEPSGEVAAKSASGGIDLDFAEGFPGCAVQTVSGDVTIGFPDPPDAKVRASSVSGGVSVGGEEGRRVELVLGSGGPELSVQTVSGDISVEW